MVALPVRNEGYRRLLASSYLIDGESNAPHPSTHRSRCFLPVASLLPPTSLSNGESSARWEPGDLVIKTKQISGKGFPAARAAGRETLAESVRPASLISRRG